jgi:O-antigen/teichoic acid export membrane protein
MSLARRILQNTFVQVVGKVVMAGISVIILKIITGYLGTSGYGDYTAIYQFLAFFGIIADFGIYTITVKEMSRDESRIPVILGNVMGLRTFLAVFAMLLSIIAVFLIPSYSGTLIPIGVLIATLATILTLLTGTITSVLQVHLKMGYATIGLVLGKAVSVIYMAWVAYYAFTGDLNEGFHQLIWAGVAGNLASFLITGYYTRRFCKITYKFDFKYWKTVFLTSLPFGVALILNTIYLRIDIILMTLVLPHSQTMPNGTADCIKTMCSDTEIGLYGVAMRFLEMMVIIPVYFMNSVLPVMTRFIEEQSGRIKSLMQYSFDFLTASALPILMGSFILARPIILFISDREFLSGEVYAYGSDIAIRILMFAMMFSFVNALFGFTLVVLNKQLKLMYINALAVLFNLVSNIFVIPLWGFRAASVTSVMSEMIILIFTYTTARRVLGFHIQLRTFSRTLFSTLIMGLVVWGGFTWMKDVWFGWQLALLVPLGGLTYVYAMFKTKAVTAEMVQLLKKQ